MTERAEFKLPLMGKLFKLRRLPNQPADKKYALAVGAFRQPGQKIGYLMELTGSRRGKLLAWLQDGGTVYECTEPLAYLPEGKPAIMLSKWSDAPGGRVDARVGAGDALQLVSQYRGTSLLNFFEPSRDLGKLPKQALGMGDFLAASYLEFVEFPRLQGASSLVAATAGQMRDVLAPFREGSLPDACDMLVFRVDSNPDAASGFERYAAWLLKCAHAEQLRAIAAQTTLRVSVLSRTGLFWLQVDDARLDDAQRAVVLGVESALNRCKMIDDEATKADGLGALASFGEAYCSQCDFALLRDVAKGAGLLIERGMQEKPRLALDGASAQPNGEWDVRTRFADAVESLALPYRLAYWFDSDVRAGVLAVDFTVPATGLLPGWRWGNATATWEDVSSLRPAAASCYALRMGVLLAAAGFGAGMGVTRVVATARVAREKAALLSVAFDRIPYLAATLPALTTGRASALALEGNPLALLDVLSPASCVLQLDAQGGLAPIEPLSAGLPARAESLGDDRRPLPAELAHLLHADLASDLDIWEADTAMTDRVRAIAKEADDSPIAAIAELELLVAELSFEPREGRMPLYCDSFAERLLIGLASADADARYYRVPDADYLALFHLSRLYLEAGDTQRALAMARRLCSIAPIMPMAAVQLAAVLAEQEAYAQAARVLKDALGCVGVLGRIEYLHYRLAWILWQDGKLEAALAAYLLAIEAEDEMAEPAKRECAQLMEQMSLRELPSKDARSAALEVEHIPAAPTSAVRERLRAAAVGLVDAGLHQAAWRAMATVWWAQDDVMASVRESLRTGIGR